MRQRATKKTFLSDAIDLASMGARSLESDNFSECFRPVDYHHLYKSGICYIFSFVSRYFILFPLRLLLLFIVITLCAICFFYGVYISSEATISYSFTLFFQMFIFVFNCHIKHHGTKRRMSEPHVYVSNHTSFIDFMILSSFRFCHACISENHGGLFGFVFNTILSRNGSIAFKRSEKHDRESTLRRIRNHIRQNKAPMLIFPEGTVVNNEYVVLFQKGAFELDAIVCPVGIKYKKRLFDPYWNRRFSCFTMHLLYLMTRWRIEADVHWLEPVTRHSGESPIEFSHRVKNMLAQATGLKNTLWNGYFKSSPVIKDRVLFKTAFFNVYKAQQADAFGKKDSAEALNTQFYLADENIYCATDDQRLYFGTIAYDPFVNECCKEYLRLKSKKAITSRDIITMTKPNMIAA